jgi:CheY-like chemotaxis protein
MKEKKRILLIDKSLTVQKVVALTLDRGSYDLNFAETRDEAVQLIRELEPAAVLISDQIQSVDVKSFPKELELWLRGKPLPKIALIVSGDSEKPRHYAYFIKKPFAPSDLRGLIENMLMTDSFESSTLSVESDEKVLERKFDTVFNDESSLVEDTLRTSTHSNVDEDMWNEFKVTGDTPLLPDRPVSNESKVDDLSNEEIERLVGSALNRILPPIVERLVAERLDKLLQEPNS